MQIFAVPVREQEEPSILSLELTTAARQVFWREEEEPETKAARVT